MISRFRSALSSAIAAARGDGMSDKPPTPPKVEKFPYNRPSFLQLSVEEVAGSKDFSIRPILIPRDVNQLPWMAGYAEALNGGKSDFNEDQAVALPIQLKPRHQVETTDSWRHGPPVNIQVSLITLENQMQPVEATYYAIFDGHAGYGAAVCAGQLLHKHIKDKLEACLEIILNKSELAKNPKDFDPFEGISADELVVGALEEAFAEMDDQIERELDRYFIPGGCTALVALLFYGKLYVANAGDCRAVLGQGRKASALSNDFTAESEKPRVNLMGYTHQELLHNEFSYMEFQRRINKQDIGKRILCRYPGNEGWTFKTATEEDLKFPLVIGTGKRARLMGTIGVSRGFGDHKLYVMDSAIAIKPFLSSHPEVSVSDLSTWNLTENDFVILGSDGLWDTITTEQAVDIVLQELDKTNKDDDKRYTIAAQELVLEARGRFTGRGWKKRNEETASFDDITAFVIPLKPYSDFWKSKNVEENLPS